MRKTSLDCIYELAKIDERVMFIGSDLGAGTLANFKNEIPERFFMEGISEANVIGMAAGLALAGRIVYVNTIATFLTRRAYEQIALDLCLHNANVRLIGNGGGVVYGPLGPTHQAIEDIGLMSLLPNMTVLAPADAHEMRRLIPQTLDHDGPVYIRVAKGGDRVVTDQVAETSLGKAVLMREGSDILLITTGIMLQVALAAADLLAEDGVSVCVLHFPTIKPLDTVTLNRHTHAKRGVMVLEEHVPIGGLATQITQALIESGQIQGTRYARMGLPDTFIKGYGSQDELLKAYGLDMESVRKKVHELLD